MSSNGGARIYVGLEPPVERSTIEGLHPRTLAHIDIHTGTGGIAAGITTMRAMSKAVTLAQPISAAAIAINPLPVHRSSTLRPGSNLSGALCRRVSRSHIAAGTPSRRPEIHPGAGYVVVTASLSRPGDRCRDDHGSAC